MTQIKKKSNSLYIKTFLNYITPYKWQVVIVLLALIITSFSVLALGFGLKLVIDYGFIAKNQANINEAFLFILIAILLLAAGSYIRASTLYILCERVEANIRKNVFSHVLNLSPSFFENNKISEIVSRLTVDTTILNSIIANLLSYVLRNIIMAIGGLYFLFSTNLKLSFLVLSIIPVIIIPFLLLYKKIKLLTRNAQDKIAHVTAAIDESLNALKTIHSFTNEDYEIVKFNNIIEKSFNYSRVRYLYRAAFSSIIIVLSLLSICSVLYIGSNDVLNGKITAGELSSFIFYSIVVASSISGIAEVFASEVQKAVASCERIFEIFDLQTPNQNLHLPAKQPIIIKNFDIEVANLSFSRESRPDILKNISFFIPYGQTTAIVGESGSGKTTIIELLQRFYEPTVGEIKLGGHNIQEFPLNQLRNFFAVVPQEPIIFSTTVLDNIKYGNLSATEEEVEAAMQAAEILDFFTQLPDGINTYLGEKGAKLSVGQKQRIAIARAIIRKPKILLLDEATSALDSENEKQVQHALERLKSGKTIIIVSHRINSIKTADNILLLENGNIIESGNFNELQTYSYKFRKLFNI